jgi:hypothetical protein
MHHSICGLIFSPSSPEKRKASPDTVGWPWPEVGEDGEDAWFGVSPEMGMVEWVWGFLRKRLLFLYNKIK